MCTTAAAKRRRKQAAKGYRHLAKLGRLDEDETVFIERNDGGATFEQLADRIERMYLGGGA